MLGARCTKYQLEPAPLPSVSTSLLQRQALRVREGHGLGDRLDDAGAHDLIGCLGGLAAAGRPKMRDRLAERGQNRPRALKASASATDHDGQRRIARAFDCRR